MIIGCLGPEGSNKTTAMTCLAGIHYAHGGKVFAFPGYDVFTPKVNGRQKQINETIQLKDWVILDDRLDNSLICIDEMPQWFDAQMWMQLAGRLFGYMAAQRRKRGLSIVYTAQESMWVNNRIRHLTHVFIYCWDLYWSSWGKENGLKRGERGVLTFIDNKGFFTGYPNTMMGQMQIDTKRLHDCFDTKQVVNVWEGFAKAVIKKRPEVPINIGPDDDEFANDAIPPSLAGVSSMTAFMRGDLDE